MITLSNASIKIIEHIELYIEQDMEEDAKHTGSQAHWAYWATPIKHIIYGKTFEGENFMEMIVHGNFHGSMLVYFKLAA